MLKKLIEAVISFMVAGAFCFIFQAVYNSNIKNVAELLPVYAPWILGVALGLIFYLFISSYITDIILKRLSAVEDILVKMSAKELLASVLGCVIGLAIANLIGFAFNSFGAVGTVVIVFLNIILGYLGFRVARIKKDELDVVSFKEKKVQLSGRPKILDTSVIIDGRILDLLQTGFIEGKIIIPNFVLDELRHIADSSDSLKRNRGRRGLDILNEIQKQLKVPVEIVNYNTKEFFEVDAKLLKMAEDTNSYVVTNDFNLNKVAEFQGVRVLNINELANAIKPIVLPGEVMKVTVMKDGKENGQGIAYLNDGTMIVVEGGRKYIGETIMVIVTSILQTAAGRMIFVKKKED